MLSNSRVTEEVLSLLMYDGGCSSLEREAAVTTSTSGSASGVAPPATAGLSAAHDADVRVLQLDALRTSVAKSSTGAAENWTWWRERAVLVSLCLFDEVLQRESHFVSAVRTMQVGPKMYALSELLLQHPHAVSSIARYAGYARDARLQALSLRVLYRLAMCERCLSYPQQLYSQLQVTRCVGVPGGGVAGFGNSL